MKEKTHTKLNISIPNDLHSWVVKKRDQEQKKTRIGNVGISHVIADCIEAARQADLNDRLLMNEGNENPPESANIVLPSENSGGGSSTRPITSYRQAGKRK